MKSREINKFRSNYKPYRGIAGDDGLHLAVLFDEKDDIKSKGGKWNPAPEGEEGGHWSMPNARLDDNDGQGPGTIRQWLDGHAMIVGPQGPLNTELARSHVEALNKDGNVEVTTFSLRRPGDELTYTYKIWGDTGLVSFNTPDNDLSAHKPVTWLTLPDARLLWEVHMLDGFRKIEGLQPEVSNS
jgi:hypothetical protein